jgi:hypothetical protein
MGLFRMVAWTLLAVVAGAVALGAWFAASDRRLAAQVAEDLDRGPDEPEPFDPAMVAGLPEVAQRYFAAAIAPGTPLHRVVHLEMEGEFLLGARALPMRATQVLAPPEGFVWQARMGRFPLIVSGSDGWRAGQTSWTRFWLAGIVPLARVGGNPDHMRAAAARGLIEAIWAPTGLLPQAGAEWRELAPDIAEVRFPAVPGVEPIRLVLDAEGRVAEATVMRWTDANPERRYRLQPFGGQMTDHATHQGFTVPVAMEIANMVGTPEHAPFFRARITGVRFGPPPR